MDIQMEDMMLKQSDSPERRLKVLTMAFNMSRSSISDRYRASHGIISLNL